MAIADRDFYVRNRPKLVKLLQEAVAKDDSSAILSIAVRLRRGDVAIETLAHVGRDLKRELAEQKTLEEWVKADELLKLLMNPR